MTFQPALQLAYRKFEELLRREISRFRAENEAPIEAFQGIFISSDHVDRLVSGKGSNDLYANDISEHEKSELGEIVDSLSLLTRWKSVIDRLKLSDAEAFILMVLLAPEIDTKFETIYSYLNNNVSQRYTTRDLVIRLLRQAGADVIAVRSMLGSGGALFRSGFIIDISHHPLSNGWLAGGIRLAPMVSHALVGCEDIANDVASELSHGLTVIYSGSTLAHADLPRHNNPRNTPPSNTNNNPVRQPEHPSINSALQSILVRTARECETSDRILLFKGKNGSSFADAAIEIGKNIHAPVVKYDPLDASVTSAFLHQSLYRSILLVDATRLINLDASSVDNRRADESRNLDSTTRNNSLNFLIAQIKASKGITILTCESERDLPWLSELRYTTIEFETPSLNIRESLWRSALNGYGEFFDAEDINSVADRFVLTPGQISHAVQNLKDNSAILSSKLDRESLFESARNETRLSLGSLARKVDTPYSAEDLILPEVTKRHINEISSAINVKNTVYSTWNFGKRFHQGQGVKALFSGVSGTGKTMAASVIAKSAGLDLYAIDLSGVVSKYIGETEKNLDKVFFAAESSNAILFFDECDALLGKRSEVKDAHDRYANIEVAYLLQKMELHPGAVILATNFSKNMDQAFARRIQFVVEFPIPDSIYREKLWRGMFPEGAPLCEDVDFKFLSEHFAIAGGDIKNVALDSAFIAAGEGTNIRMKHLVRSMGRQLLKQGRAPSASDFKHYFPLLTSEL